MILSDDDSEEQEHKEKKSEPSATSAASPTTRNGPVLRRREGGFLDEDSFYLRLRKVTPHVDDLLVVSHHPVGKLLQSKTRADHGKLVETGGQVADELGVSRSNDCRFVPNICHCIRRVSVSSGTRSSPEW